MPTFFIKHWKALLATLIIITVIGFFGFGFFKSSPNTTRYITAQATVSSINQSVSATGTIVVTKQRNYGFQSSGKIKQIDVKVGDTVKKDQQMAKLDTIALESALIQSQANLQQTKNNYANRNKNSNTQYDTANLLESVKVAQSKVNLDKSSLNNLTLKSSIDGTVAQVNNIAGDTAGGNMAFMVITDNSGANHNVNFASSGRITKVYKKVGDPVRVGYILGTLDDTQARANLVQSEASLNQAQNNYANRNKNVPNEYDVDNLQQNIKTAQAKVDSDQLNLDMSTLKADIDGVVTVVNNGVGDSVSASGTNSTVSSGSTSTTSNTSGSGGSSAVISVVDMNSLAASMTVPESDVAKIKIGQSAELTLDALEGRQFTGKVVNVDQVGTVSSNVVSYGIKITFDKLSGEIKPAMTVSANILINSKDNVLTIPSAAIKTNNGQKTVQILSQNSGNEQNSSSPVQTTETKQVKTGISNDSETEITDGLSAGDQVVVSTISGGTPTSNTGISLFGGGNRTNSGANRNNNAGGLPPNGP